MRSPTTVADLVAAANSTIESLEPRAVVLEIEAGDALIVDLREAEELDRHGLIEHALHAPRGMLEFYADASSPYHRSELRRDRRVILYCASGGRSALAVKALEALGYRNLAHLEGGLNAWKAAGFPVASPEQAGRQ